MRALALACALVRARSEPRCRDRIAAGRRGGAGLRRRPAVAAGPDLIAQIEHYRKVTWRWQQVMGVPRTDTNHTARRSPDRAYRRWVLRLWKQRAHRVQAKASRWLVAQAHAYQQTVAHWQHVHGRPHDADAAHGVGVAEPQLPRLGLPALAKRARRRCCGGRSTRRTRRPGAASIATRAPGRRPAAPYFGGLQMDLPSSGATAATCCGRRAPPTNWTPLEQMWVADRALRSGRGFYPWPNTARMCGLI